MICDDGDPGPRFATFLDVACDSQSPSAQLGVCAALVCATRIDILALRQRVALDRGYLESKPISVHAAPTRVGAELRLSGLAMDGRPAIRAWRPPLASLLEGFPLPVFFNGKALPRPFAVDNGRRFCSTKAANGSWVVTSPQAHALQGHSSSVLPVWVTNSNQACP